MVGERGPELFVPGSSGTIVPAGPTASLRESMGSPSAGGTSPVLNMTFETTRINGTEYVSREQLEAAMMQTRRQASADGARRGMSMTLDKLQQSPQTRSRVGIG
jgi:phage-related minor tail protein